MFNWSNWYDPKPRICSFCVSAERDVKTRQQCIKYFCRKIENQTWTDVYLARIINVWNECRWRSLFAYYFITYSEYSVSISSNSICHIRFTKIKKSLKMVNQRKKGKIERKNMAKMTEEEKILLFFTYTYSYYIAIIF